MLTPRRFVFALIPLFFALLLMGQSAAAQPGCDWSDAFKVAGLDGDVTALAVRTSGGTTEIFAGGHFAGADGEIANHVARWADGAWSLLDGPLGVGLDGPVRALAVWDDGTGEHLFAAGDFEFAGGVAVHGVARWDGTEWSALGNFPGIEPASASVHAIAAFDPGDGGGEALYFGGEFESLGGVETQNLARWDGTTWSAAGPPVGFEQTPIFSLLAGDETTLPGLFAGRTDGSILHFDGVTWSEVGSERSGQTTRTLALWDDGDGPDLYAAGHRDGLLFIEGFVARRDGDSWTDLANLGNGQATTYSVADLQPFSVDEQPVLVATGRFDFVEFGDGANHVAGWNGSEWLKLEGPGAAGPTASDPSGFNAAGFNDAGSALAVADSPAGLFLIAGGQFTLAGDVSARRIASWDGSAWSPLPMTAPEGPGVDGTIHAFVLWNDGNGKALYAAGSFATAGGVRVNHVARWNGVSWQPLADAGGVGLSGPAYALSIFDDGSGPALYVGGLFETAGGETVNNVARWDGQNWSSLGGSAGTELSGPPVPSAGQVRSLATWNDGDGDDLYVGGLFDRAGGIDTGAVARWDGISWSPVAVAAIDQPVSVNSMIPWIEDGEPSLVVSGEFSASATDPLGNSLSDVALWNGSDWQAMEVDVPDFFLFFQHLTLWNDGSGPGLVGVVSGPGDSQIVRWTGDVWTPLESLPVGFRVSTLQSWRSRLYAAGYVFDGDQNREHQLLVWSGTAWDDVEAGSSNGQIETLYSGPSRRASSLFAGGDFSRLGSVLSSGIARLDCGPFGISTVGLESKPLQLNPSDSTLPDRPPHR